MTRAEPAPVQWPYQTKGPAVSDRLPGFVLQSTLASTPPPVHVERRGAILEVRSLGRALTESEARARSRGQVATGERLLQCVERDGTVALSYRFTFVVWPPGAKPTPDACWSAYRLPERSPAARRYPAPASLSPAPVTITVSGMKAAHANQKWLAWTIGVSWAPARGPDTAVPKMFHAELVSVSRNV